MLDFRIHVTVGDEEVEPTIVVIVDESAAKAQYFARRKGDPRLIADLVKVALSGVVPQMVRAFLEVRNIEIQPTVVIIVT